jgi:hypothetical protein
MAHVVSILCAGGRSPAIPDRGGCGIYQQPGSIPQLRPIRQAGYTRRSHRP